MQKMQGSYLEEEFIEKVFSKEGMLERLSSGYEERPQQKEMASHILNTYQEKKIALIEAGTGTGKSFAYLVPAVIWALKHKQKTVISTHTIALQEQLLKKDIPFLLKAINKDIKVCLVKGMKNYLCLRKLKEVQEEPLLIAQEEYQALLKLEHWAEQTEEGSRSDISFAVAESVWDKLAADPQSCSHVDCPQYKKCFFFKARFKAQDAQLLIVNHALLFADIQLRQQEKEGVLPAYTRLVLDEAHHIEHVALESSAQRFDRLSLVHNLVKIHTDIHPEKGRLHLIKNELLSLSLLSGELQENCQMHIPGLIRRTTQHLDLTFAAWKEFLEILAGKQQLDGYKLRLKPMHTTHPLWKQRIVSCSKILEQELASLEDSLCSLCKKLEGFEEATGYAKLLNHILEVRSAATRCALGSAFLLQFFSGEFDAKRIRWVEVFRNNIMLFEASLDVSTFCNTHLFSPLESAILCSATLATARTFTHVKQRLGLQEQSLVECIYDSPFDFASRSLFLVPTDLPLPHESSYLTQLLFTLERAIEMSKGGTFILFTSYDMLSQCYKILSTGALSRKYPLLKQGDLPRHQLLEEFKKRQNSVLLATDSFWEGVDVPGDALRCVIIVKLPFPVPTEPFYEAYAEALEKQGIDPFSQYAIPLAVIKFKQGFGRLLRTKKDRGCVLCLDPRLIKKNYGKFFLSSLPPSTTYFNTRDKVLEEMQRFYTQIT